jgi:hypothetical protein
MKKMKLMKIAILFLAVLTFSNCEEDGEIQFIVVDEFETNAKVTNLSGQTTFSITDNTDISDLLDGVDRFVDAEVEKVTLTLVDGTHDAGAFGGQFAVSVGGVQLIAYSGVLTEGTPVEVVVPAAAANVLNVVQDGLFPFELSGTLDNTGVDDDFTINLKFKIKGTVE